MARTNKPDAAAQASAPMAAGPGPVIAEPEFIPPGAVGLVSPARPEPQEPQDTVRLEHASGPMSSYGSDGPGNYRLSLACPTELAHRNLVVSAVSQADARDQYFRANGISGSQHTLTIQRTQEPATDLSPVKT